MTRDKMTQILSETMRVSTEKAAAALEAREWNLLDAAQRLQQESARNDRIEGAQVQPGGWERLAGILREWLARVDRSRFDPRRSDADMPGLTAAALAPLMLMPSVYASRCC